MLYLLSGSSASGKKTIARAVAERLPQLSGHHDNEKVSENGGERLANLDLWVEDAIRLERQGIDLILGAQSPLGELLAAPRAIELEGIAPCLLDCHDFVRWQRILDIGIDPEWPIGMDTFCWAVFHRMHARDPQWEQHVCTDREHEPSLWSRWLGWSKDDPRWNVFIHDSTEEDLETTIQIVVAWIETVRRDSAPLMREDEWWE